MKIHKYITNSSKVHFIIIHSNSTWSAWDSFYVEWACKVFYRYTVYDATSCRVSEQHGRVLPNNFGCMG